MYNKIQKWIYHIENHLILSAIKKGFLLVMPIVLTGSFALLLLNFPIPAYQKWLLSFGGGFFSLLLNFIFDSTSGFVSLYLVLAISYFYSEAFAGGRVNLQIMSIIASLACFVASFGGMSGSLELSCFGTVGVFSAMLCAIIATRLFFAFNLWYFRHFRSYAAGNDIHYHSAMAAIIPMVLSVTIFALANLLLIEYFHVGNLNDLISNLLFQAFKNVNYEPGNGLLFLLLLNLLWFFGVHGGNALDTVAQTIFLSGGTQAEMIISKSFLDNFSAIGGSGTSLCLVLALLLATNSKTNRQLAYSAVPLALFNINEILVFGLPIVLNPILIIPFVLTPLIAMLIAYSATICGWIPIVEQNVNWTTPVLISGYVATESWKGACIQLLTIVIGTTIYFPFIRLADRLQNERTSYVLHELTDNFRSLEKEGQLANYLERHDQLGIMAKKLVSQLRNDLELQQVAIYYQPQVNEYGQVIGAEALLRWQYDGETVYPPLVVALAQEDGCFEKLTWLILTTVCQDMCTMEEQLGRKISVSANVIAEQLNNEQMVQEIITLAKKHHVQDRLVLEVTEETSLANFSKINSHIEQLGREGISLAIDDFSMGQTSLNYLRDNKFRFVKLDGSLVRQVADHSRCREIINSIVTLGNHLGFQVVAEWVENEAIRDHLLNLGCKIYQGYFFSPAVPLDKMIAYTAAQNQSLLELKQSSK